jgi:hypothetical protein
MKTLSNATYEYLQKNLLEVCRMATSSARNDKQKNSIRKLTLIAKKL